jgi:hypothetical protein
VSDEDRSERIESSQRGLPRTSPLLSGRLYSYLNSTVPPVPYTQIRCRPTVGMVTVVDFVVQLIVSVVDLVRIFLLDVLLGVDPLTAVSFLIGGGLTTAAVAALGYLAVGAVLNRLTGAGASAPDSGPKQTTR